MTSSANTSKQLAKYPHLTAYIDSLCSVPEGVIVLESWEGDAVTVEPVRSFRMGATPVTVALWKEYCVATGREMPPAPRWGHIDTHPIVNVSWNDIMGKTGKGGFCQWASKKAGFKLTLPEVNSLMYMASDGIRRQRFPWGDIFDRSKLWCSRKHSGDAITTAPVARVHNFFQDKYGISDIVGNVREWCLDLETWDDERVMFDPEIHQPQQFPGRILWGSSWKDVGPPRFTLLEHYRAGYGVLPGSEYSDKAGVRLFAR